MERKKQFKWSERVTWAKAYISAVDKIECRDDFIMSYPDRYDMNINNSRNCAHILLKKWVALYNKGMKNLQSQTGINAKGRPKKVPLSKLNDNDLEIYQEIVEELLKRKGVTNFDIAEELRKKKEKVNDKTNLAAAFGLNRKLFYFEPKGRAIKIIVPAITKLVEDSRKNSKNNYGYYKIFLDLNALGHEISLWNVRVHYEELDVVSRRFEHYSGKPKEAKSTNIKGPNLVGQDYIATKPNEKWFTDVSYVRLKSGRFIYLSLIIDSYSNKVIYWTLSFMNDENLATKTLAKAVQKYGKPEILHTDHGSIYFAKGFQKLMSKLEIKHSLSGIGNSLDNRPAEFVFGLIKHEGIYHDILWTFNDAEVSLESYISWYNKNRIQTNLKNMSPDKYLETYAN